MVPTHKKSCKKKKEIFKTNWTTNANNKFLLPFSVFVTTSAGNYKRHLLYKAGNESNLRSQVRKISICAMHSKAVLIARKNGPH